MVLYICRGPICLRPGANYCVCFGRLSTQFDWYGMVKLQSISNILHKLQFFLNKLLSVSVLAVNSTQFVSRESALAAGEAQDVRIQISHHCEKDRNTERQKDRNTKIQKDRSREIAAYNLHGSGKGLVWVLEVVLVLGPMIWVSEMSNFIFFESIIAHMEPPSSRQQAKRVRLGPKRPLLGPRRSSDRGGRCSLFLTMRCF